MMVRSHVVCLGRLCTFILLFSLTLSLEAHAREGKENRRDVSFSIPEEVEIRLMNYTSFDGMVLEVVVVFPSDFDAQLPYDAVIIAHGGTGRAWDEESRFVSNLFWMVRLARNNYIVLYPDARLLSYRTFGPKDLMTLIQLLRNNETAMVVEDIACHGESAGYLSVFTLVTDYPSACDAFIGLYPAQDPENREYFTDSERLAKITAKTFYSVGTEDYPYTGYVEEYDLILPEANPTLDYQSKYYEGSSHGFFFQHGKSFSYNGTEYQARYDPNWREAERDMFDFLGYSLQGQEPPLWWNDVDTRRP